MDEKTISKFIEIPKERSKEITKALHIAAEIEERARDFYSQNAEKASDQELKEAFNFLVKEEQGHYDIIKSVEEAMKKEGKFAVVDPSILEHTRQPKIYPQKGTEVKSVDDKNELTVLLWAMRAERKAELFYRAEAKKAVANEVREFFTALAEFEVEHFKFLDGLFSTWTSTDDFILG